MKNLFLFLLLLAGCTQAQGVEFVANAPNEVTVGTQFRLCYTLCSDAEGKGVEIPEEINGFQILFGPTQSVEHSTSEVNGTRIEETKRIYTYILTAEKEGSFTLPEAKIMVDGKNYKSNKLTIKVLPPKKD